MVFSVAEQEKQLDMWKPIWNEHNMESQKSNPSKHLNSSITRHFNWSVTCNAAVTKCTRNIQVYFIATLKSTLNDPIESDLLDLFKNGIMYFNVNKTANIPQRHSPILLFI